MKSRFQDWDVVAGKLNATADHFDAVARDKLPSEVRLNEGQRASLRAIATRIADHGVLIADEVGMGKTRIAVEVARAVVACGGRVAILVPPGLGYQWRTELLEGGVSEVSPILRSLKRYFDAWNEGGKPWQQQSVTLISHSFTNWRLGDASPEWRWALVPKVYARLHKIRQERFPYGHKRNGTSFYGELCCDKAAQAIVRSIEKRRVPFRRKDVEAFLGLKWNTLWTSKNFAKGGEHRNWLERLVGFGLGAFDLVIIDEAHKNRGSDGSLSRLINHVVAASRSSRRLAMTATPVELDVSQWSNTLSRLKIGEEKLKEIQQACVDYANAVKQLRSVWQTCLEAKTAYISAAQKFQQVLSPYVLRRDKREDEDVIQYSNYTAKSLHAYRHNREIAVDTTKLDPSWRRAICAAEALSVVSQGGNDSVAKRVRLTIGNGHGVASLLDLGLAEDDELKETETPAKRSKVCDVGSEKVGAIERKRKERAQWWLKVLCRGFESSHQALYHHPAILATVEEIEKVTQDGGKVLVFGRFTKPLRELVRLLNAREMLRRIDSGQPWPQSKVFGDKEASGDASDWGAVRAAHKQLNIATPLDSIDDMLGREYDRTEGQRRAFRNRLVSQLEAGINDSPTPSMADRALFKTLRERIDGTIDDEGDGSLLALVARAILSILGDRAFDATPMQCAEAFSQLIAAVRDPKDSDETDGVDDEQTEKQWEAIEVQLAEEYGTIQGGFARLMYGETRQESRRLIQFAFNRINSFPKVLVAQSRVGREGLNLHRACRVVILLHPEWNPGVVEQQIGRIDRVGSYWSQQMREAIGSECDPSDTPCIEVRPVIFRGTYDEWNWQVLQTRWDDLRAQLHGAVIPSSLHNGAPETMELINQLEAAAPSFSPTANPLGNVNQQTFP